jgi:hypothetical protein
VENYSAHNYSANFFSFYGFGCGFAAPGTATRIPEPQPATHPISLPIKIQPFQKIDW